MRRPIRAVIVAALAVTGGLAVPAAPAHAAPFCERPNPPPACDTGGPGLPPRGSLSTATRVPAGILVTGRAEDPDGGNVRVDLSIGGRKVGSVTAGANGQFAGTVPAVVGSSVCATGINNGPGHDVGIGCLPLAVSFDPVGSFDALERNGTTLTLRGWAVDGDTYDAVEVQVHQDGKLVGSKFADQALPGPVAGYAGYGNRRGFVISVPEKPVDGDHTICLTAVNRGAGTNRSLGCKPYSVAHQPFGALDAADRFGGNVRIRGWAVDPDEPTAPVEVQILNDGQFVRSVVADANRPGLDPRYGPAHGFDVTVPATLVSGPHQICVFAKNRSYGSGDTGLGCKEYTLPAPVAAPVIEPLTGSRVTSTSIELRWGTGSDVVDGHLIERSTAGGPWERLGWLGGGQQRVYQSGDLTPGTRYCYRITVDNVLSEASAEACATTLWPALPAPADLTVVGQGENSLKIRWTDNAEGEDDYLVAWRPVGAETWQNATVAGTPGTGAVTYTIRNLNPSTEYEFGILPRNAAHEAGAAVTSTAWTNGGPRVNGFTSSVSTIQACVPQNVTLNWTTTGANRVVVKRGDKTLYDKTQKTVATWSDRVSGESHDGNVGYTLTAYGPDGRTTTSKVTVQRVSAWPLISGIEFNNTGWYDLEAWYFDQGGNRLKKAGDVPSGGKLVVRPPHCELARIQLVYAGTGVVHTTYHTYILGHKEGRFDQLSSS
ncbi:fibronectin type III domain-containing protein [Polymorphospora rubra]|uniref:fibronectin type III domain-containing protein n=1 Tax=Polymorphospora rubra TaxID=338584 RepID=UPI0033CA2CE7